MIYLLASVCVTNIQSSIFNVNFYFLYDFDKVYLIKNKFIEGGQFIIEVWNRTQHHS